MAKVLADLILHIAANTAELTKGIQSANSKLAGFEKSNKNTLASIKTGYVAAAGAAVAAFKLLEGILNSTGNTADNLQFQIDGVKGAATAAAQMIATLDFSRSLRDAYEAARDLSEAFDDFEDRQLSLSMISAENKNIIAKLKKDLKDADLSTAERLSKEQQIQDIVISEARHLEDLANDKLTAINVANAKNYKLSVETAALYVDYLKNYTLLDDAQKEQLNLALQYNRALKEQQNNSSELGQLDLKRTEEWRKIKEAAASLPPELAKYLSISGLILDTKDKEKQQIADIYIQYKDQDTALTNISSSVDRYGDRLDKAAEKATKLSTALKTVENFDPFAGVKFTPPTAPMDISGMGANIPSPVSTDPEYIKSLEEIKIAEAERSERLAKDAYLVQNAWQTSLSNIGNLTMSIADAFSALGSAIEGAMSDGKMDLKDWAKVLFTTAMSAISVLTALAAAEVIAKEASKGIIGVIAAIAGVAMIVGTIASLKPKKMAEGGLVYGNSIVNVGEYPGARSNPEVIAPLDKLQTMLGTPMQGEVRFIIEQNQLVGILSKANDKSIYF